MKVLLILVDGMRPDALAGIDAAERFMAQSAGSLAARTVFPSVTLPCHMSLFHSVAPDRHGILTNTYVPQVRPVPGLAEALKAAGKTCAFFYNWEQLRDLSRPGSLAYSCFLAGRTVEGYERTNRLLTDQAEACLQGGAPDFTFVYLGWTDEAGHKSGWMSEEYLRSVRDSWDCIGRLARAAGEDACVIVTADHGGHERSHGTQMPEDMTIPLFFRGAPFPPGACLEGLSILDIAPTVAALLGVACPEEWEGRPLTHYPH